MRKAVLLLLILITTSTLYAQHVVRVDSASDELDARSFFSTVSGEPYVTAKFVRLVEGSPYLQNEWADTRVILQNGGVFSNISTRLNLLDMQLHFQKDGADLVLSNQVKEISFANVKTGNQMVFRNGYGKSKSQTETFFEVLADGQTQLLKEHNKTLVESKQYGSSVTEQKVVDRSVYHLYHHDKLTKVKLDKKTIEELLNDKTRQLNQFAAANNLNLRSEKDFATLINHYNSLQ